MATAPAVPHVTASDRLGLTLFMAAALHAVVILGITFNPEDRDYDPLLQPMEITLVHSHSDEQPDQADYLAQANQKGGGNIKEKVRPSSPFPNASPSTEQGNAPESRPAAAPPPRPEQAASVLSAERESTLKTQLVEQQTPTEPQEVPQATELMARSLEVARLSAEIRRRQEAYAQQPRHKYITANTKEHTSAAYEEGWRLKVERIGNLNYPDEAKRRNLTSLLILDVAIRADGSLHGVKVLRSSGHKVLDDGARRIVQLAAPYAPFPEAMKKEMDVLHIIRTWQFRSDHSLTTR